MKYIVIIGIIVSLVAGIYYYLAPKNNLSVQKLGTTSSTENTNTPELTVLAENLDTPWAIVFLPDKSLLVTERKGTVRKISSSGQLDTNPIATLPNVLEIGEGGLLGMALHPNFKENNYVYFYYTYRSAGDNTLNRVVRMTYTNNALSNEQIIIDAIPGASNHNGGRIKFGPDNLLYVTTGDAQEPSQAQDTKSLAGKILRVTDEGKAAPNNPFNNLVYSYGHRNPQGIDWDENGNLWSTEHGRSGVQTGLDEVNLIEAGKNYGWPTIQGNETQTGMESAVLNSGSNSTWAPGSAAVYKNSLFFGGLRGASLYEGIITNNSIESVTDHYNGEFGRIREVIRGPDNLLYITTSNQDGRGVAGNKDDRVIRINPEKL